MFNRCLNWHLFKQVLLLCFIIFTNINFSQSNSFNDTAKFIGNWQGKLNFGTELRIIFKVQKESSGIIKAFMDSPDQGVINIPIDKIIINKDNIKFNISSINGNYEGTFYADSNMIKGTWNQSGFNLPLNLTSIQTVEVLKRPQEPKPPFPYNAEELTFENKSAKIILSGTFTYPKEGENFPVVILISGSGPQNRDEELLGHKPFLVLSDYLTRNGIAVLRFDDRGVGKSEGNFSNANTLDFASDVKSALEYIKSRKEINKEKIGLIGHSEGGLIAPMVAIDSKDIAFIILMAAPGLPGEDIILTQMESISKAEGIPSDLIQKTKSFNKEIFNLLKIEKDSTEFILKAEKVIDKFYETLNNEEKNNPLFKKDLLLDQIKQINSSWFRFFIEYDPRPTLRKVKIPVLAVNGENDLQVSAKENLNSIEQVLKEGGNRNYSIKFFPKLNHLFQKSDTGKLSEYGKIEETINPVVLETLTDWIKNIIY